MMKNRKVDMLMEPEKNKETKPLILAPAGNRDAFLAAVAAGADAVYCGLKQYSARMEAKNFTLSELAGMIELAHEKNVKVYLALNSLLKTEDLDPVASVLVKSFPKMKPDALIVQDLAIIEMARQAGYAGEIHLSTLANVSFPGALKMIRKEFGVDRVVVPRELSIDEIKSMAQACPPGLTLEVFVHGALCYGVSGRCYWSSYLGGKSGLRGQCVQPCRRQYVQNGQKQKFFSCQDLSLDVLVKVLSGIPQISAWKIEGRKKSPHYVFYTTSAYRMLRDHGGDPKFKKSAIALLERALGRSGTHYFFLPQRPYNPVDTNRQTGSGLLMGKVSGGKRNACLIPREELLPGDVLRLGYEDETWHKIYRVKKYIPKKGRFNLAFDGKTFPAKGTPVFLTDRREKELEKMISELSVQLSAVKPVSIPDTHIPAKLPRQFKGKMPVTDMTVYRNPPKIKVREHQGLWLSVSNKKPLAGKGLTKTWWWLPPVVWPDEEKALTIMIQEIIRRGGRHFVLNAPWQMAFFGQRKNLDLWAGPFCNIANPLAVDRLKKIGFSGVMVSPELSRKAYFRLPKNSSLPLGMIVSGNWPLCLSRVAPQGLKTGMPFVSPKKEQSWGVQYDSCMWIYPNWALDIQTFKGDLIKAGYCLFVTLTESMPKTVDLKKRPGKWNWDLSLR